MMKIRRIFQKWMLQEDLNFLLTNRIPRITLTRFMGWWSQIRHPWVVKLSMSVWRLFSDLDLSDAKHTQFDSLHACFTRELKPGARVANPDPCAHDLAMRCHRGGLRHDHAGPGVSGQRFSLPVGNFAGHIRALPALASCAGRGHLHHLAPDQQHVPPLPCAARCALQHVTYISGDTWNVNPVALARVQELFCKNERAVLHMQTQEGVPFLIVPVAAVLVASMRFHAVDVLLNLRYKGPNEMPCDAAYVKGQEMGWFEHGSTILVFVPKGFALAEGIAPGEQIRMGQALLKILA
jgi:phosphatidylserine decarboxylase